MLAAIIRLAPWLLSLGQALRPAYKPLVKGLTHAGAPIAKGVGRRAAVAEAFKAAGGGLGAGKRAIGGAFQGLMVPWAAEEMLGIGGPEPPPEMPGPEAYGAPPVPQEFEGNSLDRTLRKIQMLRSLQE